MRAPEEWHRRGGVLMPMHQAEAMWLLLETAGGQAFKYRGEPYPFAIKVGTGKVDAITGKPWAGHLNRDPQDYLVLPEQRWLDGYCVEKGLIRQFVAMPLGSGYSAEEQLTGEARWGGLQLLAYPMKADSYRAKVQFERDHRMYMPAAPSMGLAPGGLMRQEIYEDPYDLADRDQRRAYRCFVTIVNSSQWLTLTGEAPPHRAPSASAYAEAGLPWFDYYDGDAEALEGAAKLANLKSVAKTSALRKDGRFANEAGIAPRRVHGLPAPNGKRPGQERGRVPTS